MATATANVLGNRVVIMQVVNILEVVEVVEPQRLELETLSFVVATAVKVMQVL
jgi:hypothetical protein